MTCRDEAVALLLDLTRLGVSEAEHALFTLLAADLRELVCWTLRSRALTLPPDEVEDVVQELLIEAWQIDLHRYDPAKGTMRAFLRSRVRWRVLDAVRRLSIHHDREADLEAIAEPGGLDAHPEVLLAQAAEEGRLLLLPMATEASLARLSEEGDPDAADAVRLHDLEGRPLRELARRLQIHPSNATRARQRAMAHLREDLPAPLRAAA